MKLLLLLSIFITIQSVSAQQNTPAPFKRFAVQAGISVDNMDFNKGVPAPAVHESPSWKAGLTIGLLIRIPLTKNLFLQPEYTYVQRRGEDKELGINYFMDYISMPVLLVYNISPRFGLIAGPQAELLISAKSTADGISTNITHDVEERSIGVVGGFEVQASRSIFFSARYLLGFNHIGIGQRSDTKEFKYEVVSATAGVRF